MPDMVLRSKKTCEAYAKFIQNGFLNDGCNLCKEKPIKNYKHWKLLENKFPWDRIAEVNHMIMPKRHVVSGKLNLAEKKEFEIIKEKFIEKEYDLIAEATQKKKSIPGHLHLHLIVLKTK